MKRRSRPSVPAGAPFQMEFRQRLTGATASAVAVSVILASALVYVAARGEQLRQVDAALAERAEAIRLYGYPTAPGGSFEDPPPPALGGAGGYAQYVNSAGVVLHTSPAGADRLPVTDRTRLVAAGRGDAFFDSAFVDGTHLRLLTTSVGPGVALQVARPLSEVDSVLARLRIVLLLIVVGGILLGASLGTFIARTVLAPVDRLTEAAERIARTRDPSEVIDVTSGDELGRLAASFNTMLHALDESLRAQRQLVADASHELRTPLTSLRTNVEVLARTEGIDPAERERLLRDIVGQLEHLTALVGDLVELARDDLPLEPEDVRLDEVVERAAENARLHWPSVRFEVDARPTTVRGVEARLERAVSNLLDNAGKWSPTDAVVRVRVADGTVEVRDHGPGIAPEDLPLIFERFYRAPGARAMPGSGLGLAIVRHVAQAHHGTVEARNADDGGALFKMTVPVSRDGRG